jgi:hypothetical protein
MIYSFLGKACVVNLVHIVSRIAAIAILWFHSSLIVIRQPPDLYSYRIIQVHIRRPFLHLLLFLIVLTRSIFFLFLNNGFFPLTERIFRWNYALSEGAGEKECRRHGAIWDAYNSIGTT